MSNERYSLFRFELEELDAPIAFEDDYSLDEPQASSKSFGMLFIHEFDVFVDQASDAANGKLHTKVGCNERLKESAIPVGAGAVTTLVTALALAGVLTGPASFGISTVVGVVSAVLAITYTVRKETLEVQKYKKVDVMLCLENTPEIKLKVATLLARLYANQRGDSEIKQLKLAKASMKLIANAMLDGKVKSLNELLDQERLAVIVRRLIKSEPSFRLGEYAGLFKASRRRQSVGEVSVNLVA